VFTSESCRQLPDDWLAELGRGQKKLANGTRLKIRNIVSVVFRHGSRHGFLPRDGQAMAIIGYLQEPVRTMALVDASTGLRASELTGLRWQDVDFNAGVLHVRRGVVTGIVGEVKTDASKSRLPLAAFVLDALESWRRETPHVRPSDWIFASPRTRGKKPFRANSLLRRQMRMAVAKAGVQGSVGWHTFRRSVSTWMIENNENVKVTQELLRHANSKTTLDLYAKAVTPSKRLAHERIVDDLAAAQQRIGNSSDLLIGAAERTWVMFGLRVLRLIP
jgi:integrase